MHERGAIERPVLILRITTSPLALWAFFREMTRFLAEQGFATVAVSSPGEKLNEFQADTGVPVETVAMRRRISPVADVLAIFKLWRIVRRYRPTIVHSHTPKAGLLGMIAARLAGVRIRLYTIHGLPLMTRTGWQFQVLRIAERAACGVATNVYCVSRSVRQAAIDLGICPAAKIRVLGYGSCSGVNLERFSPAVHGKSDSARIRALFGIPEHAPLLGFIGRLVRDKGIRELAGAWQRLRTQFPEAHLLCCGEFEPHDPVPCAVRDRLRQDPRVHFTNGFVNEMPPIYAALDVCLLPTYREGLPTVALECAAMQVPMVATRVPGCTEAIEDGVTGLLIEPRSAEALAAATARLMADANLREAMGRAGREFVRARFSEEASLELAAGEYRRLLRARGRGPDAAKRIVDLAGAAAALILLAPVTAAVAAVIRLRMGRPVLFRQKRAGQDGRTFLLYKFRTMTDATASDGAPLPDAQRLTSLGWFLRRSSLDELPQLWNVLKGEMSLVGPRPLYVDYVARYTPEQRRRLEVKPGLTGWAQVQGRNAIAWERKFELDVWYVDHRGLALDLRILAATINKVLRGGDISHAGNATMPDYLGPLQDSGAETVR